MTFLQMMMNMFNKNQKSFESNDDVSLDEIIMSDDFDDTLIAAWGGFK